MRALLTITGVCAIVILTLAAPGYAGQPVSQTLNPPPPAFETCKSLGNGTLCEGSIASSYGPIDTGLICGSGAHTFHVFDAASENEVARRVYDADGFLVRRDRHDRYAGQLSNPSAGTALPYTQAQEMTDELLVPGDLGSATTTLTGEWLLKSATDAPVLIGAGRDVFAPDGSVEFAAGPSGFLDLLAGADSALAPVCAALAAA